MNSFFFRMNCFSFEIINMIKEIICVIKMGGIWDGWVINLFFNCMFIVIDVLFIFVFVGI